MNTETNNNKTLKIFNTDVLRNSTKNNYRRAATLLNDLVENEHYFILRHASVLLGKRVSFVEALSVDYKNLFDKSDERYECAIILDRDIQHYWEKRQFALWYCVTELKVPMEDLFWSESEIPTTADYIN